MRAYAVLLIYFCAILAKCYCSTNYYLNLPKNVSSSETHLGTKTQLGTAARIVGGHPATFVGTKHVVSLRLKSADKIQFGDGHLCEGGLVNPSYIVVAANCLFNNDKSTMREANELVVVMGTLNRFTRTADTLEYNVNRIHSHPKFSLQTLENNIATVIFDGEVPKNYPYAEAMIMASKLYPKDFMCQVDGWGLAYDENNAKPLNILLTAGIEIVDQEFCQSSKIGYGMICAGNDEWVEGNESCQGDSGGVLSCDGILVGIGSPGEKCGNVYRPSIYTGVHVFREWILKNAASSLFQFKIILYGIIVAISKLILI